MRVRHDYHGDKEDLEFARQFAHKVQEEAPELVHAVVLFGSAARATALEEITARDIDVLVIVDDRVQILNEEVIAAFRVIVHNTASSLSKRFHINNIRLSEFMDFVRNGDPIAINMLRDGVPLLDDGLIKPLKVLLEQGQIKPSEENCWVYFMRAPTTIQSAKWHVLQGTLDLYWAIVDAAHAALLSMGHAPYHPQHLSQLMQKEIINKGLMPRKHAKIVDKYYKLQSDIVKRKIRHITGKEFDGYAAETASFIEDMKSFIQHHHPRMHSKAE